MLKLSRCVYVLMSAAFSPLLRLSERWLVSDCLVYRIRGRQILVERARDDGIVLSEKIDQSLALVEQFDANRVRRIDSLFDRIVVTSFSGARAAHFPGSRTCFISTERVVQLDPSRLAILIVAEAARARLSFVGIRPYPELRKRIEHRRAAEEVSFVLRMPQGTFNATDEWITERLRPFSKP